MDFHPTETTCMPSILFHFLTFSAGTFLVLLAQKKYHKASRCLFYTAYDKLVQWLHVNGGVWQLVSGKLLSLWVAHCCTEQEHSPSDVPFSSQKRSAALNKQSSRHSRIFWWFVVIQVMTQIFKGMCFSNLLTINGWSFSMPTALQHNKTITLSYPYHHRHFSPFNATDPSGVHYKKKSANSSRFKMPFEEYWVMIGFTRSCYLHAESTSVEAPFLLTDYHEMFHLSLNC